MKYIAYFDILGFKNYLTANERYPTNIEQDFGHLFRNSQTAMSNDELIKKTNGLGYVADLNLNKINCLHVSDSIIFWTEDDSEDSFNDILKVSTNFYQKSFSWGPFLLRGAIDYGSLNYIKIDIKSNSMFSSNVLHGRAFIDTYQCAENQNSATTCFTESLINKLGPERIEKLIDNKLIFEKEIQFKNSINTASLVLPPFSYILESFNEEREFSLKSRFVQKNPTEQTKQSDFESLGPDVILKMQNTMSFFKSFLI